MKLGLEDKIDITKMYNKRVPQTVIATYAHNKSNLEEIILNLA